MLAKSVDFVFAAPGDPIADLAKRIRRLFIGSRERHTPSIFEVIRTADFSSQLNMSTPRNSPANPTMAVHSRWSPFAGSKTGATFVASMV
jgi:hypothetical protein